ncbi:MAG TPA: alcohol dehydrogenase catalytic domain-containing protein [Ruminiclostridium sp.]|nr:alcohol dehydrogenase catalytic domain-containing protein [Ruminiclostridium sp.]
MQALKYKDTWNLDLEEVNGLHATNPYDVIVAVSYCGICGTDVGIASGAYPVAVRGVTLGHEATGVVAEVGEKVENVKVGDRVVINPTPYCGKCRMCQTLRINHCQNKFGTESGVSYDGTYADLYKTTQDFVYVLPENVSLKAGTFTEPLSCILTGLRKIKPATMTAYSYVFGAGPMGLLYVWALSLKGIVPVLIESSPSRLEFAKSCLPHGVKVYASLEEAKADFFHDANAPMDLVVDTTSGLLEELYPKMACGSTYMSIGLKQKKVSIDTMQLADKSLTIMGSIDSMHGSFLEAFHLIVKGVIPVEKLVSHTYPLREFKQAFAAIGCDLNQKKMTKTTEPNCKVLIEIGAGK